MNASGSTFLLFASIKSFFQRRNWSRGSLIDGSCCLAWLACSSSLFFSRESRQNRWVERERERRMEANFNSAVCAYPNYISIQAEREREREPGKRWMMRERESARGWLERLRR